MSTFQCTIEQLEISPHPNADKLELARVGGYYAVVKKDEYASGDYALYIPEAAIIPQDLLVELGLEGRLSGSAKNRVKAVRLRGQLSQGIVCVPSKLLAELGTGVLANHAGEDHAETLGITKWEPPVPANMAGQLQTGVNLVRWSDIENIKKYPEMFVRDETVVVTEKIHGTCFLATYNVADGELLISSKVVGAKNLSIVESEGNLYWQAARRYGIGPTMELMAKDFDATTIAIFGEVFGQGVQDLPYCRAGHHFAAFDLYVAYDNVPGTFINAFESLQILTDYQLPTVPLLWEGPYDYDKIEELATGEECVTGEELHMREGVVVRPFKETISSLTNKRKIAKFISPDYLTRKGDVTEHE